MSNIRVKTIDGLRFTSTIEGILLDKNDKYITVGNATVTRSKSSMKWEKYSVPMDLIDKIEYMED